MLVPDVTCAAQQYRSISARRRYSPTQELLSTMDRTNIESVIRSLRRVNLQGSFFGQTVAIRFGLTESDVEALEVLLDTGASTAGRLSELMGLTTGAVTRVIDRLEQAGYVRRVPDPTDRRRVIVEVVSEKATAVESTLDRVSQKSAAEIDGYTDEELAVIERFLVRVAAITRDEAVALRDQPVDDGVGSQHVAPLGGLTQARLLVRSGANQISLGGAAGLGDLYRAKFDGPVPAVRLRDGTVTIQYKGGGMPWDWRKRNTDVVLNASIPWDIELNGGANKVSGELGPVDVRSFAMLGGVDRFRLTLGRPVGAVPIRLAGGVSQLHLERPAGVPVQLRIDGGAGQIAFDRQKLGGVGGGTVLETAPADTSPDRYVVELDGGAGRIVVRETVGG
jgi:DNA-binding MarR family transcriptional regulator